MQNRLDRILEAKVTWSLDQKNEIIRKYEEHISQLQDTDQINEMQLILQEVKDNLF
jgi:hypothetical protein